jgi:meso-butanediol dehydrogenase/(S,S)-butanediol dehydrogenase/diacetyl reductase
MEKNLERFKDKTAVITGAGSGIGRSIALRFAEEGADVGLIDVNDQGLKETAEKVQALSIKAVICRCDMSEISNIDEAVKVIFEEFKNIDILVNGAGIGDTNAGYDDLTPKIWDKVYSVNVKGPFFLIQKIAKQMADKGIKGRIINIASTEGKTNRGGSIAYASSKSALIGLTQGLASQLAPYEITVNSVCPGLIDTPIWHRGDKSLDLPEGSTIKMVVDTAIESRQVKIMRVGEPEEIAAAVAFLASTDADYMTGQAINICGGLEFH